MAEFSCEGCGYLRQVSEDLAGKRAKCPECGQSGPVFPSAEPPVEIAVETSDRPAAASETKPCWYWPDHPAKRAMVIATAVWGVLWLQAILGNLWHYTKNGLISGVSDIPTWLMMAVWLSGFAYLPLYFATIGVCFVAYFVMSDSRGTKSA